MSLGRCFRCKGKIEPETLAGELLGFTCGCRKNTPEERVRDLCKEISRLDEIVTMVRPSCEDLHHRPNEYHEYNQECPVMKRLGIRYEDG
jgi:hypothetical protein